MGRDVLCVDDAADQRRETRRRLLIRQQVELAFLDIANARSEACKSARNLDPGEMGRANFDITAEIAQGWGSRSAPIGTPSRQLFCRRFQCLSLHSGWGPDWVLKHT